MEQVYILRYGIRECHSIVGTFDVVKKRYDEIIPAFTRQEHREAYSATISAVDITTGNESVYAIYKYAWNGKGFEETIISKEDDKTEV